MMRTDSEGCKFPADRGEIVSSDVPAPAARGQTPSAIYYSFEPSSVIRPHTDVIITTITS